MATTLLNIVKDLKAIRLHLVGSPFPQEQKPNPMLAADRLALLCDKLERELDQTASQPVNGASEKRRPLPDVVVDKLQTVAFMLSNAPADCSQVTGAAVLVGNLMGLLSSDFYKSAPIDPHGRIYAPGSAGGD